MRMHTIALHFEQVLPTGQIATTFQERDDFHEINRAREWSEMTDGHTSRDS